MIKICLCDDDRKLLQEVGQCIQDHMLKVNVSAAVTTYSNPVGLANSVADGERYDLYILDVEMPEMSGFETAQQVREYQPNAGIIFLTAHLEHAHEGYKVDALRYVSKLKLEEEFPEALTKAIKYLEHTDKKSLHVQHYNNVTRILLQDIIYVCKAHRSVHIVTVSQGTIIDNRGIKDIFETLDDPRFIFTDRSYFVNLDYAQQMDKYCIHMKGGAVLPISRPMLPKVKEAIIAFCRR